MPAETESQITYRESLELASEHYENFPVASFLFPKKLRKAVALIYRFARTADDIVDEGSDSVENKVQSLEKFRDQFLASLNGQYENEFWKLLKYEIDIHNLDSSLFFNLLKAFEQDISVNRYKTFNDLLNYCKNSANPVGRIILQLYDINNEKVFNYSDKICTALQLTNFWQDVKIDIKKGRVYIPLEDFEMFNSSLNSLHSEQITTELRQIIKFEVDRTEQFFSEGETILLYLPYRLRLQVAWTISGGRKILQKIRKNNYDVLNYRPTLSKIDYAVAFFSAFFK